MHRAGLKTSKKDSQLIEALMRPAAFDHPVTSVELIETHISWVILTDDFVYKIKKPIKLEFVDFSDLERRRHYCAEEIRLNRPWAPEIYIDVVAITLDGDQPRFLGSGTAIEYAVRMRRFDSDRRLDCQLNLNKLTADDMRELGRVIAAQQTAARVAAPDAIHRYIDKTKDFMRENFRTLAALGQDHMALSLFDWTEGELKDVDALLTQRFNDGFVRECHGDLHLANLVRLKDGITTFDCIEFNDDLRIIDVICDTAFLVMDLVARGRRDLAAHFLNRYLECSGDYEGVALVDMYFVYRCLVRAKVAAICSQESTVEAETLAHIAEAERYCGLARRQISKPPPVLIIMTGLSGSGKTRVSSELMASLPAIRIRSDIERRRLFGLDEQQESKSGVGQGIYTAQSNLKVYSRLAARAETLLSTRHNVIVDATFLRAPDRDSVIKVADEGGYAALFVNVEAQPDVMRERLRRRAAGSADVSEANLDVLERQLDTAETLTGREMQRTIRYDNNGDIEIERLRSEIQRIVGEFLARP